MARFDLSIMHLRELRGSAYGVKRTTKLRLTTKLQFPATPSKPASMSSDDRLGRERETRKLFNLFAFFDMLQIM